MLKTDEIILRHPYPNYHEQGILIDIVRMVQSLYSFIEKIILYGSKARGDYHEESDIDLLFVIKEVLPRALKNEIYDSIFELEIKHGVVVSVIFITVEDFDAKSAVFIRRIHEEGILLWSKE